MLRNIFHSKPKNRQVLIKYRERKTDEPTMYGHACRWWMASFRDGSWWSSLRAYQREWRQPDMSPQNRCGQSAEMSVPTGDQGSQQIRYIWRSDQIYLVRSDQIGPFFGSDQIRSDTISDLISGQIIWYIWLGNIVTILGKICVNFWIISTRTLFWQKCTPSIIKLWDSWSLLQISFSIVEDNMVHEYCH